MNTVVDKTIIMLATVPWHYYWQRQQEWATRFAKHNRVIYVAPYGSTNMGPIKLAKKIATRWMSRASVNNHSQQSENILHLKPLIIPWHGNHWINKCNGWLFKRQINRLTNAAPEDTIIWVCNPADTSLAIIERFPGATIVYDIAMRFARRSDVGKHVPLAQNILAKHADHIFYDAPASLEDLPSETHAKAVLVPQGINEQFLQKAVEEKHSLWDISRPRIGYVGAQNDAFDATLVRKLVHAIPNVQIVLIGDFSKPDARLDHERIHRLGAVPFNQLPQLLNQLDVGIIPYLVNDFTAGVFPTKALEYVAAGLPTISTHLPALKSIGDAISITNSDDEFIRACKNAIALDKKPIDKDFIQKHTWAARFSAVNGALVQ